MNSDGIARPNPALTPGAAVPGVSVEQVCAPGYASTSRNPGLLDEQSVFQLYLLDYPAGLSGHRVDRLIPSELGGADTLPNLWPEPTTPQTAGRKDQLAGWLHQLVCSGAVPLETAQRQVADDWYAAWLRYGGTNSPAPDTLTAVGVYSNEASIEGNEGTGTKTSNKVEAEVTSSAPEFGRCVKVSSEVVGKKTVYHGGFTAATCLVTSPTHTGKYEWYSGVVKAGFTMVIKPTTKATLETIKKVKVTCTGESSSGEITSVKTVGNVVVKFTGCASGTKKCTTTGLGEGELETKKLEGVLGIERITVKEGKETRHVALDLYPVGKTGAFLEYTCTGSAPTTLAGSILAPVTAGKMLTTATLKFTATAGKQKPERFEGGEKDVLTNTLNEQVGLTVTSTQTYEELVEINAVA